VKNPEPNENTRILATLWIDGSGKVNFHCRTAGDVSFEELKSELVNFRSAIDKQLDNEKKCPFYGKQDRGEIADKNFTK